MALAGGRKWSWRSLFSLQFAVLLTAILFAGGVVAALTLDQNTLFLPGETSEGHFLFEASCSSCHDGFQPVTNETCNRCHEAEMAEDIHGSKKFLDPRWAAELSKLEVLTCTTCHNEHVHMFGRGVHLQPDLCMTCHQGIVEGDLKSHDGFAPDGCWTGGCHNYHDHRSLSTGFLRENMGEPPMLPVQQIPDRAVTMQLDSAPKADLMKEFLGGGQS